MLRCLSRYRSQGRGLWIEAGETVDLGPELESILLRDSPESFEVVPGAADVLAEAMGPMATAAAAEREAAERAASERDAGAAMSSADNFGAGEPEQAPDSREAAARQGSERGRQEPMTAETHEAIMRPESERRGRRGRG